MELESQPRGGWFLLRLSNMSTITREWEALHKLRLLPFVQPFLSGHFQPADAKPRMYAPPVRLLRTSADLRTAGTC